MPFSRNSQEKIYRILDGAETDISQAKCRREQCYWQSTKGLQQAELHQRILRCLQRNFNKIVGSQTSPLGGQTTAALHFGLHASDLRTAKEKEWLKVALKIISNCSSRIRMTKSEVGAYSAIPKKSRN